MPPLPFPAKTALALACCLLWTGCSEIRNLREIKTQQDRRIRELQAQLDKKSDEHLELSRQSSREINLLRQELDECRALLERERAEAQRQRQELEAALAQEKNQRALAEETRDALQQQIARLEENLVEKARLETRLQAMSDEAAQLEQRLAEVEARNDELEKALSDNESMAIGKQAEIEALKKALDEAQAEIDATRGNAERLQTSLDQTLVALDNDRDGDRTELQNLREEVTRLRERVELLREGAPTDETGLQKARERLAQALAEQIEADQVGLRMGERGLVLRLSADYLFLKDSVEIDPEVLPALERIGAILADYPEYYVEIQGHTDDQALVNLPFIDNWALGAARAGAVTRYLVDETALGPEGVKSSSYSEYRPLAPLTSPTGRQLNRRVEIILSRRP